MRFAPCLLLLSACLQSVDAAPSSATLNIPNADQLTRIGGTVFGKRHVTTTGDTYLFSPPNATSGGYTAISDLRLVAWNAPVTATCAADTILCWTQTATLTVSTTSNLIGILTDASGADGPGACFLAPAGIPVTDMPLRTMFSSSTDVGYRAGVCINQADVNNNGKPCAADADCVTTTSGYCSTAISNGVTAKARQRGAFLMLQSPAGASYCFVSESQ
jgi:hypothetical protein